MSVLPVAGSTFTFGIGLEDQANAGLFKAAPTIAAGDFQISVNGGAFENLDNLPTVTPAGGRRVQIVVSAAETTAAGDGGNIYIRGVDTSGDEWYDIGIELRVGSADMAVSGGEMDLVDAPNTTAVTAFQSGLATAAALAVVDGIVDSILEDTGTTLAAAIATAQADLDNPDQFKADVFALATAEAIAALNDLTAAEVWAYATRTLTQTAAAVAEAISGSTITITRGDTFSASLTGLGSVADRSNLWFTIKAMQRHSDSQSIVQVDQETGLLRLNGQAATAGNGSIAIDDEDAGNITISLDEAETADLAPATRLYYDVQMITTDGVVSTLTSGTCVVEADVTRVVA